MKTKTKLDTGTKLSLAEDIIIIGLTLFLTATITIQIMSAVYLFREGHPWICLALSCTCVVNALLLIMTYSEVIVDKMEDLL